MVLVFFALNNFSQMETRFSKRRHGRGLKAEEVNKDLPQVAEEANVGQTQDAEEVPIPPKKKKPVRYSPNKLSRSFFVLLLPLAGIEINNCHQPSKKKKNP